MRVAIVRSTVLYCNEKKIKCPFDAINELGRFLKCMYLYDDFRGKVVVVVQVEFFKNLVLWAAVQVRVPCTTVQLYSAAYGCNDLSTGHVELQESAEKIDIFGAAI